MADHKHNRRATDRTPSWLLPTLLALIAIGALSIGLTVQSAQEADVARAAQVDRIERLIERLDTVADRNQADVRLGHRCILDALRDIADDRPVTLPETCNQFKFNREDDVR